MYGSMKNTIWKPHIHYFTRASLYHLFSQYFEVEALGFYGSALYVFGIKSKYPTFKKVRFQITKKKGLSG